MSDERWIVKMWAEGRKHSVQYKKRIDAYRRLEYEHKVGQWVSVGIEYEGEMIYERRRAV